LLGAIIFNNKLSIGLSIFLGSSTPFFAILCDFSPFFQPSLSANDERLPRLAHTDELDGHAAERALDELDVGAALLCVQNHQQKMEKINFSTILILFFDLISFFLIY
jgi:hypothetical protein